MEKSKVTFRTVSIDKQNFLHVINPDQQIVETDGHLSFNTGIYGTKTDDAFPEFVIDLYQNAAGAHQNLINLKANLILGNNLQAEDEANDALVDPFLAKRNKAGDNLKTSFGKWSKDMALFNACVAQVVYNFEGKIVEVYHIPTQNFRLGKPNKYGQIQWGYLSPNWGIINNSRQDKSGGKDKVKIRMYDPENFKKYPVQLIYMKDYNYGYYAFPAYSSAINWLLVSREISDFHKHNIRANFFLSGILVQKKGGMSDTEIDANSKAIQEFFMGGKGRKVLEAYVDDIINDAPVWNSISPDNQDKLFDVLSQQAFQEIVTAHNAYSILAGADSKGSDLGGDSNKLVTSLQAFNYLVCEGMKEIIIGWLNRIAELNGTPPVMCITEPPKIAIPMTEVNDLTINERRAMVYGLPEVDESTNNVAPDGEIPTQ